MEKWFIDKRNGFLTYRTQAEDIKLANEIFARDYPESNLLNKNTVYDKKESRMAGILGEIVFSIYAGDHAKPSPERNSPYDFLVDGKKVDVKCKMRSVIPQPHFEASFFAYQSDSYFAQVDYYAFLSTVKNFEYVWFCGYIGKDECADNPNGVLWKAGVTDPTNGKVFHKDTWSIFYRYINRFNLNFDGGL